MSFFIIPGIAVDGDMGVSHDDEDVNANYVSPLDDDYVSPLNEDLRLTARTELREDENIRIHSLKQMREWIHKHPDIEYCRTGKRKLRSTLLGFGWKRMP